MRQHGEGAALYMVPLPQAAMMRLKRKLAGCLLPTSTPEEIEQCPPKIQTAALAAIEIPLKISEPAFPLWS